VQELRDAAAVDEGGADAPERGEVGGSGHIISIALPMDDAVDRIANVVERLVRWRKRKFPRLEIVA
jgi:hypothetical protein